MASTTAMTTTTSTLGTSDLRGSSRQTRNNPTRTSRTNRPNLRQNSLISNPPASVQSAPEPHGFYPAISHFTDAVAALPRDYRRHISLLKEVDAKAWLPEENLQKLLGQCLVERQTRPVGSTAQTIAGSSVNTTDDTATLSASNSVSGAPFDNGSQYSSQSVDPAVMQRRQLYHALRHNLMQMMVTMDEKNHVINNANEDLSRHVRRLNDIWPHISDEVSEEARLGSLKHWALTDLNPPKKAAVGSSRREAAAGLATMMDNDIAHRSESRREAMLAKKQRLNQPADSDFDDKMANRKGAAGKSKKVDAIVNACLAAGNITPSFGIGKRKKPEKPGGAAAMERSTSNLRAGGGMAMSREPSQQENGKKRKAPAAATTTARKRLNAGQQESPKLAASPLVNSSGKDAVKRSPALSSVRPVGRGRQNSAQVLETSKSKSNLSTSNRNNSNAGVNASTAELNNVAHATGKSTAEVRHTMKELTNNKGDKLVEDDRSINGDSAMRGGILLERSGSSRGGNKRETISNEGKAASSPRIQAALMANESKSGGRGRGSKISTPVVGTFADADADDHMGTQTSENGTSSANSKARRAPRPRMKDHHGLHDSLSPKGLPMKRTHGKNLSLSSFSNIQSNGRPSSSRARNTDKDDETSTVATTATSQSNNNISSGNNNRSSTRNQGSSGSGNGSGGGGVGSGTTTTSTSQTTINSDRRAGGEEEVKDEEEPNDDDDELRYCYCNGVSYGEMVACDNQDCVREWFHLDCIGLKSLPRSAKWYCDECKENLARKGRFGSNGHGDK